MFDHTLRLVKSMTTLIKHRQFQMRQKQVFIQGNGLLKHFARPLRPLDHAVTLANHLQDIGAMPAQLKQSLEVPFRLSEFKATPECARRIR